MRHKVWLIMAIVCLSILCLAGSLGATTYVYEDLTLQGLTLNPTGSNPDQINAVNDGGWIVGSYYDAGLFVYRPFVWRPGLGRTTLPLGGGGGYMGYANGINNAGRIVGERYTSMSTLMPHYPCLWPDPLQDPVDLYVFDAKTNSNAYGINAGGFIAGESVFAYSGGYTRGAFWAPNSQQTAAGGLLTLGGNTASGRSINNSKLIAGTAANASGQTGLALFLPLRLGAAAHPRARRHTLPGRQPHPGAVRCRHGGRPSRRAAAKTRRTWAERNTTRKPELLLRLSGWFLLRPAQRALSWVLFLDPPRTSIQAA